MNIALCHYRVGETDGVSLEMDKWKKVLEDMGHKVIMIAGSKGTSEAFVIDELEYRYPEDLKIEYNAYVEMKDFANVDEFIQRVNEMALVIEKKLTSILKEQQIDVIVPNNILSIGRSIPTALAFVRVIEKMNLKVVNHHHDFYWERENFANPTSEFVQRQLDTLYPPVGENIHHVLINHQTKEELKKRKNIDSYVVPNVFDFEAPMWVEDTFNQDFREAIGINEDDIFLLQATRVTDRKAIELAIDLAAELNQPENLARLKGQTLYNGKKVNGKTRFVLVLVGLHESSDGYIDKLKAKADTLKQPLIWCEERISHSRNEQNGTKTYSLWDAYVHADIVTYPSILEGWGNQFLEGLFAKKPMAVFEYDVFLSDIKEKGFHYISFGQSFQRSEDRLVEVKPSVIHSAAEETMKYLLDASYRDERMEENFELGRRHFSLARLRNDLEQLFSKQK